MWAVGPITILGNPQVIDASRKISIWYLGTANKPLGSWAKQSWCLAGNVVAFCAIAPAFLPWRPEIRSCKREMNWPQIKHAKSSPREGDDTDSHSSLHPAACLGPSVQLLTRSHLWFQYKMFYVEPGEFERLWKCFGRSLPFLSHSCLPVWNTRQVFLVFCPLHMVKGHRGTSCQRKKIQGWLFWISRAPHPIPEGRCSQRKANPELIVPFLTLLPAPIHSWSRVTASRFSRFFLADFCPSNCEHLIGNM